MNAAQLKMTELQKRIVWRIRQSREISRIELARALHLAPAAMTRLTRELTSLGVIAELEAAQTGDRGRPTVPITLSGQAGYAVGATVHPGWIDMVASDFTGRQAAFLRAPFHSPRLEDFSDTVEKWMAGLSASDAAFRGRFLGLGVAAPGPTTKDDPDRRHVVEWLSGWRGRDLALDLSDRLFMPVWVENDANCAALAELYCGGVLAHGGSAIVLFLGHGVGGGVIMQRDVFLGEFRNAGEIGRLFPGSHPRPSGIDLLKELRAAGAAITDLFEMEQVIASYPALIEAWCLRVADQLVLAVHSGVAWFDPGAVILSGALPAQLVNRVTELIAGGGWLGPHQHLPQPAIIASALGSKSVVIGASLLPIHACTVAASE